MPELTDRIKGRVVYKKNRPVLEVPVIIEIPLVYANNPSTFREVTFGALNRREAQTATLMIRGLSNKEIAEEMHIGMRTVKYHVSNIFRKTNTANRYDFICKMKEIEDADNKKAPISD